MTRVRLAKKHWQASTRFFVLSGLFWFAVFLATTLFVQEQAVLMAFAFASFVLLVGVVLWRGRKSSEEFRCPECGGEVGEPLDTDGYEGAPILRPCRACDILWHVGSVPSS